MRVKEDPPPSPEEAAHSQGQRVDQHESLELADTSTQSETSKTRASRSFTSKIPTPSKRRVQNVTPPPGSKSQSSSPSGTMDGVYERSMKHLAAKEHHLKRTEKEMMEECTFTPETNKSKSSSHGSNTTVFDRLYSSESKQTTPKKGNGRKDSQKQSPTMSVSSHGSSRIEYLYQDGLRRAQSRRLTDREEAEARRRRLEEEELQQCTFRPNMDWRKKKPTPAKDKTGDLRSTRQRNSRRYQYSPPVHVVTTGLETTRNGKQKAGSRNQSLVSPLRGPEIPERESAVTSGIESLGEDTEYGSI